MQYCFKQEERETIFSELNYSFADFLSSAERVPLRDAKSWGPADGMTMAIVLKPEIVTKSFETNLEPVLVGDRGAVVVDSDNTVRNAKVIRNIDVTAFKNLITECLS